MTVDRIEAVGALLSETGAAHGTYEATVLKGVYHREWAIWYAAYAVDHGLSALVGHPITAERLAEFLASTNLEFEQTAPESRPTWAAWTAGRIVAEL